MELVGSGGSPASSNADARRCFAVQQKNGSPYNTDAPDGSPCRLPKGLRKDTTHALT